MTYQEIGAKMRAFAAKLANLKRDVGGMMFSGLISCVGLTALSVFSINVCSEALERERMQNAADAAAYTSATWFARGMNAVVSLNHQIGEKTAFTVVAEAMAGPEPTFVRSKEEMEIDSLLKKLNGDAPDIKKRSKERKSIKSITKTAVNSDAQQVGGGAFYDARMRLKYGEAILLNTKARANEAYNASLSLPRGGSILRQGTKIIHTTANFQEATELAIGDTTSQLSDLLQQISDKLQSGQDFINQIADSVRNVNNTIDQVTSYLWGNNSIQAYLRNTANEIRNLDDELERYLTDQFKESEIYKEFRQNVDEIKKELDDTINELLPDLEVEIGNLKVTLKTREMTEDVISKAAQKIDFINESVETIKSEAERIQNKLKREYDRIRAQINDVEDRVAKEIERVAKRIDGWLTDVKEGVDKVKEFFGSVESALRSASTMLAKAQELVDKINDLIKGGKALASLVRTFSGHNILHEEYKDLMDLQDQLLSATVGVVKIKDDLRKGIEKISQELTTVAGADKAKVAERSIAKLIADATNKLLKEYGVDYCVVTPLDGVSNNFVSSGGKSQNVNVVNASAGPIPTLPILAETAPVVKSTVNRHINNAKNRKWKNSSRSAAPFDKLPAIPWEGDDNSSYIDVTKDVYDATFLALFVANIPEAIQLMCSWYTFPMGARAMYYLTKMLIRGDDIKSSWKNERYGFRNNPSVWSYPTDAFNYKDEEVSQWVRASYPALDEMRARIRQNYRKKLRESNFTTYFVAWTYRYALSESFYCRSGVQRPYAGKGGNYVASEPASMYVIPGTNPKNKGNEPMWVDPNLRNDTIDNLFTVSAAVQKRREPIGNSKLFVRIGATKGTAAIGQAYIYPSNGRNEQDGSNRLQTKSDADVKFQPFTAWDTLGWKNKNPGGPPIFDSIEWDSQPTGGGDGLSYEEFMKKKSIPGSKRTQVEFTWQASMCPVTRSRLQRLANNPDADSALRAAAKSAAENVSVVSQ